jgi:hypothetical protein
LRSKGHGFAADVLNTYIFIRDGKIDETCCVGPFSPPFLAG